MVRVGVIAVVHARVEQVGAFVAVVVLGTGVVAVEGIKASPRWGVIPRAEPEVPPGMRRRALTIANIIVSPYRKCVI